MHYSYPARNHTHFVSENRYKRRQANREMKQRYGLVNGTSQLLCVEPSTVGT